MSGRRFTFLALSPAGALRDTGIATVVLTDAQINHTPRASLSCVLRPAPAVLLDHNQPLNYRRISPVRENLSKG